MFPSKTRKWLPCALLVLATGSSLAQTAPSASSLQSVTAGPLSLKQAFDTAWARQPEAESSSARREAATARRAVADSWTAEPMALELSSKGDQLNGNDGSREHNVGLAIPLWLPGERSRTGAVAEAEARTFLKTGLNAPYSAADDVTHTLRLHATPYGLINAMLDVVKGYYNMGLARWLTATMLTLSATTGIVLAMKLTGVWGWQP